MYQTPQQTAEENAFNCLRSLSLSLCLKRFVGGRLNMCYNALDRHVEAGLGERRAVVWDSAITDSKSTLTYAQLRGERRLFLSCVPQSEF